MAKFVPNNPLFNDYDAFVSKFERKKTTDDCYTPAPVYETVLDWARRNLPLFPDEANIVRPFYPGADYRSRIYEDNDVVVDNPPFSIISKIVDFYIYYSIPFFLFAPHLTLGGIVKDKPCSAIAANANLCYENGASINTSFVTNMDHPDIRLRTAPDLRSRLLSVNQTKKMAARTKKLVWPPQLTSAALLGKIANIEFLLARSECKYVKGCGGVSIYGGGYLLGNQATVRRDAAVKAAAEKAAAEKAAAEKAAAEKAIKVKLTPSEMAAIEKLSISDNYKRNA